MYYRQRCDLNVDFCEGIMFQDDQYSSAEENARPFAMQLRRSAS